MTTFLEVWKINQWQKTNVRNRYQKGLKNKSCFRLSRMQASVWQRIAKSLCAYLHFKILGAFWNFCIFASFRRGVFLFKTSTTSNTHIRRLLSDIFMQNRSYHPPKIALDIGCYNFYDCLWKTFFSVTSWYCLCSHKPALIDWFVHKTHPHGFFSGM